MDFHYREISFTCQCGVKSDCIATIGGTADGCIIAFWQCRICKKKVAGTISIEEIILGLPAPLNYKTITKKDRAWLKEMNIRDDLKQEGEGSGSKS